MPRKDDPDSPTTGKLSPEPTTESSPSPESQCQERDSPENRESSVDPAVQEVKEPSGDSLEDPCTSEAYAVSHDSICSRCGRSKNSNDEDIKASLATPLCECGPEMEEFQQETLVQKSFIHSTENSESSVDPAVQEVGEPSGNYLQNPCTSSAYAVSDNSMCSRCGRSKNSNDEDIKASPPLCDCGPEMDKFQQEEHVQKSLIHSVVNSEPSGAQEIEESSGDQLDDPCVSTVSDDSLCSRCGLLKNINDENINETPPTPLCECDPEVEEFQKEQIQNFQDAETLETIPSPNLISADYQFTSMSGESLVGSPEQEIEMEIVESMEEASESTASDTLSDNSTCPKCGGSKRDKNTGLKPLPPPQFICKCQSKKKDEVEDDSENVPLQEFPLVAVEDISGNDQPHDKDHYLDLPQGYSPERNPPVPDPEAQRQNPPPDHAIVNLNNRPDDSFSCRNTRWGLLAAIVFFISSIVALFIYFIINEVTNPRPPSNSTNTGGKFGRKRNKKGGK